jgi:hypothetical protein
MIAQPLATVPGQWYRFSGWIAHAPSLPEVEARAEVYLNERKILSLVHETPGASRTEMHWRHFSYPFQAVSHATTLAISDALTGIPYGGVVLDGLRVAPTTDPFLPAEPGVPSIIAVRAVSATRVELAWTDPTEDEIAFEIQRRGPFGGYEWVALVAAHTTRFTDHRVFPGQTYSYRVRAQSTRGVSEWSPEVFVTTPS